MQSATGIGRQLILMLLMGLLVQNALACPPYVVTLSAGPVWARGGSTQTLTLQPGVVKTYTALGQMNTIAEGELFLGLQPSINPWFDGQFGVALATTGNTTFSGNIWDDANPSFNNYNYAYNLNHKHIAVKGKLLGQLGLPCFNQPYISATLGVGFNTSHHFTSTPTIVEALPTPNFSSNTTTSFTYTLGIGIQGEITKNWQVGVGYEFADWGQSQLGRAPGQTMGQGLSLSHLYTNGLMLNLTYLV